MLDLSNITILTANCDKVSEGIKALRYSCRDIKFKETLLFTDKDVYEDGIRTVRIPSLKSVDEYNDFILRLVDYVDSDYILLVQDDGFILNSNKWNPDFLNFDYIGAVWPESEEWISLQKSKGYMHKGYNQVGNGGFSLRSRKFIERSGKFTSCQGYGEDTFLCTVNYESMKAWGIKFAPIELAKTFSYENNVEGWPQGVELDPKSTFGFHGHQLSNSHRLIALKDTI